ncbi:MAG: hypothetical protein ACOYLX_08740, partial [Burkholderiaceae bacterium]
MRGQKPQIRTSVRNYFRDTGTNVTTAFTQVQTAMGNTATTTNTGITNTKSTAQNQIGQSRARTVGELRATERRTQTELDQVSESIRQSAGEQRTQVEQSLRQSIEQQKQRYRNDMSGLQAELDIHTGVPDPNQIGARILGLQDQLGQQHQQNVAQLQELMGTTVSDIAMRTEQELGQLNAVAQQRVQGATQQAGAAAESLRQMGSRFQQSIRQSATSATTNLGRMADGMATTGRDALTGAETGLTSIKTRITEQLNTSKTQVGRNLDQMVTGARTQITQGAGRAAQAAVSALNRKAVACRNAMNGPGTDESAIHGALAGMNRLEARALREIYRDHYSRDLEADLRSEMEGDDLNVAMTHLSGNRVAGVLAQLNNSVHWYGDDERGIEEALRRLTPEEMAELRRQAATDPNARAILDRVRNNLGGHDRDVMNALVDGNTARADAIRLHEAIDGMGTNEAAINTILERTTDPEQRRRIEAEYARYSGQQGQRESLRDALRGDLSGADGDLSMALLDGDRVGARAARLEIAADGAGTDEQAIFDQLNDPRLQSQDPEVREQAETERRQLRERYQGRYGRSIETMISDEMGTASDRSSGLEAQVATEYLQNGRVSPELAIRYSTDGIGTNEAMIRESLRGMTPAQIAEAERNYSRRFGGASMRADLSNDLSGGEANEVNILMLGEPSTPQDFMRIAQMRRDFQMGSGSGSGVMGFMETIGATETTSQLDNQYQRMGDYYNSVDWSRATPEQRERLEQLGGFVQDDAESHQAARDAITDAVVTGIEVVGAVVATVATAGAASPALVAVLCAAGTGAVTMAARATLQGNNYGWEAAGTDLLQTGINMATAGLGNAAAVEAVGVRAAGAVAQRFPQAAPWVLRGVQQGVQGSVSGGLDSFGRSLVNEQAWDRGVEHWAGSVLQQTTSGVAAGFGGGFVGGGLEGHYGQATSMVGRGLREGASNVSGDVVSMMVDPATYSRDIDENFRQLARQGVQSFGTGMVGGMGAHYRDPTGGGGHTPRAATRDAVVAPHRGGGADPATHTPHSDGPSVAPVDARPHDTAVTPADAPPVQADPARRPPDHADDASHPATDSIRTPQDAAAVVAQQPVSAQTNAPPAADAHRPAQDQRPADAAPPVRATDPAQRPADAATPAHRPADAADPAHRPADAADPAHRPADAADPAHRPADATATPADAAPARTTDAADPGHRAADAATAPRAADPAHRPPEAAAPARTPIDVTSVPANVMGPAQQRRADARLRGMSDAEHAWVVQALAHAGSPTEHALILKAIAAGHDLNTVYQFANTIRGQDPAVLLDYTTLTDPQNGNNGIQQQFSHSCGPTTVQALRGQYDPVFALQVNMANPDVHTVNPADAHAANPSMAGNQQGMLHTGYGGQVGNAQGAAGVGVAHTDAANGRGRWVDDHLNALSAVTGAEYHTELNPPPARVVQHLDHALGQGHAVPIVVGNGGDQFTHYVLVTQRAQDASGGV